MSTPYYFGFGSLVNEHTLPTGTTWHRATLSGWRRSWQHPIPGDTPWAAMNVSPDSGAEIDGLLLVGGPHIDDYLLQRESGYRSIALQHDQLSLQASLPADAQPCLWVSKETANNNTALSLMQSYVDVVMSGYLRNFDTAGLERFVSSTDNWQLPRYNDREAPLYPRSISLNEHERAVIDAAMPSA